MEKSDLLKLKREVLDIGPEAALPSYLPDTWLNLLSRDLDLILQEQSDDHTYLTAPLALIAHLLIARNGDKGDSVSFTQEELLRYLQELQLEISFELLRRNTDMFPEPAATLETIFTNRKVRIRRSGE